MQKIINGMVGMALLCCGYCAPTWADFTASWAQKQALVNPPAGPGARSWVQLPYDSTAQRLVLIGGSGEHYYNDVWHYDVVSDSWTQIEAYVPCEGITGFTPPTPRDEHAVTFDSYNNLFWMFGGSGFGCKGDVRTAATGTNNLQIVDATLSSEVVDFYKNWSVYVPQPPYLNASVTQYDPLTRTLSLDTAITGLSAGSPFQLYPQSGGGTWSYSGQNQVWTGYDAPKWNYAGISPPGRLSGALAYSTLDHALVLFGGEGNGATRNDTWVWDVVAKTWQQLRGLNDPTSPPARTQINNAMVYDSANDVFILFGGRCYSVGSCPFGDTWAYKLATNTWTKMNPATSPAAREQPQMTYDADNRVVVMYGGAGTAGIYDDLWVYEYTTNQWTQVVPISISNPGPRKNGTLGYDANSKRFVLYGGDGGATSYDVWSLTLTQNGAANTPPNAVVNVNAISGDTSTVFQFDASASTDADGSIAAYLWDFGDGSTSSSIAPTHQYPAVGNYVARLTVTDNQGATGFATLNISVNAPAGRINVAAQTNGGVASASSTYSSSFPVAAVNNGDRNGVNWGTSGGWNDATASLYPDWVQVTFNGQKSIDEIDVFTVQDNYTNPVAPTVSMTFSRYGMSAFEVQYWDGASWINVPGGSISGNNLVWRKVSFAPVTTDRVRVLVSASLAGYSRVTEIEAYGSGNLPPSVNFTAPANNASYTAPASIILDASATDSDGTITQVEFYNGTNLLNTDSDAPFSFAWTNVPAGVYILSAKAYDNNGSSTQSSGINVTVNAPVTPPLLSLSDAPVAGTVSPAASAVTLNGVPLTVNNGAFSFAVPLSVGTTVYNIEASNSAGVALKRITVTVE